MADISTKELRAEIEAAKKEAVAFSEAWKTISKDIAKSGEELKKAFGNVNTKDSKSLVEFNALTAKSTELTKQQTTATKEQSAAEKQALALDKQLKAATDEEVKGKLRLQQINKAQKDELKDQLVLLDKNAGTLTRLAAENRKLRRERANLNLDTAKGTKRLKEINAQLDINNKRVKDSSDALKKQRLNIGNYTDSTKEAINASGLFSSQLAVLQRIQATLNVFLKKNTAETEANAVAQRGAATASGVFTKGLRILKVALISTGVGALVVALGSLITFFTKTQRGIDLVSKASAGLSQIWDEVLDVAINIGETIVDAFTNPQQALKDLGNAIVQNVINRFTAISVFGDALVMLFKDITDPKGWETLGNAAVQATTGVADASTKIAEAGKTISGIAKEAARDAQIAIDLEDRRQKNNIRRIDFIVEEERLLGAIAEARKNAEDAENRSIQQRIKDNNEAIRLTKLLQTERAAIAQEEFDILTEQNAISTSTLEDVEKEKELEADLLRTERARDKVLKSLLARQKALTGELNKQKGESVRVEEEALSLSTKTAELKQEQAEEEIAGIEEVSNAEKLAQTEQLLSEQQNRDTRIELLKQDIALRKELGLASYNEQVELLKLEEEVAQDNAKKREEIAKKSAEIINGIVQDTFNKRNEAIDKELEKSLDAQQRIQAGIEAGNADAQKSLAAEERRTAELERKKEQNRKKAQRAEAAIALLKNLGENGGDLGQTLGNYNAIIAAIQAAPSFFVGSDDIGTVGNSLDSNGGRMIMAHDNEQIWSKSDRAEVGFKTRDEIKDIVNSENRGLITDPSMGVNILQIDNNGLLLEVSKMRNSLDTLHKRMPIQKYDYDSKSREHIQTIQYENKREVIRQKANNSWA